MEEMIMSQEAQQKSEVCAQSQALLHGRLKHTRTAALGLALVPLAAIAVSTQVNEPCPSGGICGTVFYDENGNGVQDAGEPGIPAVSVSISYTDGNGQTWSVTVPTDDNGLYEFGHTISRGDHEVVVQIPNDAAPTTANVGNDDAADSDGVSDEQGNSVAPVSWTDDESQDSNTDFGFVRSTASNPGTGTPGYWKNHPEAWPVPGVTVGGKYYTKDQAIAMLNEAGKDKSLTMFSSLVPAILNVKIGNDASCVQTTIDKAQEWMAKYGVGSNVHASSYAWKVGEPLHRLMDNYNNGMLCAPHRD
jgi:hypothetical protein